MRSASLKYGFVGAGFNAKFHLAALRQLRGIKVAGVTAVSGAPELAAMARRWGLGDTVVYDSVYEMAQHVDAVAVCAPNFARVPIVEAVVEAARRGAALKGVICEKPLGRNVAEARLLVDMAQSVNLRTAYFENQIFMKPIRSQLAQLEPVQKQMGPLVAGPIRRRARRTARRLVLGPDPSRAAACCATWGATASPWAGTC